LPEGAFLLPPFSSLQLPHFRSFPFQSILLVVLSFWSDRGCLQACSPPMDFFSPCFSPAPMLSEHQLFFGEFTLQVSYSCPFGGFPVMSPPRWFLRYSHAFPASPARSCVALQWPPVVTSHIGWRGFGRFRTPVELIPFFVLAASAPSFSFVRGRSPPPQGSFWAIFCVIPPTLLVCLWCSFWVWSVGLPTAAACPFPQGFFGRGPPEVQRYLRSDFQLRGRLLGCLPVTFLFCRFGSPCMCLLRVSMFRGRA